MKYPILHLYTMGESVTAFSSTRQGGYSEGRYGEFNINRYCGDNENNIRQNKTLLCDLLGIRDEHLIMPHQVHETEVVMVDDNFLQQSADVRQQQLEGVDALMTNIPGVCIGVSTADCIPVLLFDPIKRIAAAIHAGWRGTTKRIVEKSVDAMIAAYGCSPQDVVAQIGPGIHIESFEVGDEVYEAFHKEGFSMESISMKYPARDGSSIEKWHINLPECNRQQLLSCGIPYSQITVSEICTYQQHERFFSARRLGINSGRIFTGIYMSCDAAARIV